MISSVINKQMVSHIKWRMTQACNYRCSYCIRKYITHKDDQSLDGLQKDTDMCNRMVPYVNKLCDELPGAVKLCLIGGEVSLMDLPSIINQLTSPKLKFISITTNLSQSADYYIGLIELCHSRGIAFSIAASYHEEFADMNEFLHKVADIADTGCLIKAEMVSMPTNQEEVVKFRQRCEQLGVTYVIEKDIADHDGIAKCITNKVVGSTNNKNIRYEVTRDDGSVSLYASRNEFITGKDNTSNSKLAIKTTGMYCTKDCDYVYIDDNKIYGYDPRRPSSGCRSRMSLAYYKLRKEPQLCINPTGCSLCGHMSVARDKQVLIDLLEAKKEAYDDSKG